MHVDHTFRFVGCAIPRRLTGKVKGRIDNAPCGVASRAFRLDHTFRSMCSAASFRLADVPTRDFNHAFVLMIRTKSRGQKQAGKGRAGTQA
jgi:hypothetical protein